MYVADATYVHIRTQGIFRRRTVCRKEKKPNLTETNIFSYDELSCGEKSAHGTYALKLATDVRPD